MSVAVNEILSLSFKGRASRGAYWRTLAALAVLAAAGGLALDSLSGLAGGGAAQKGLDLLIWGWLLFLAAFLVSAVVRRLHDIGLSGKWLLGYYALYWVCFYWMSTSYMQFAEDGALEGLSGQQSAAAIWIVVRPMLLALALLSAAGIAAMCIGSEKGENRYGADPTAEIPAADAGDAECVTDRLT